MNRSQLKTHNSQRGFTLIELLVVIAVIGVLAGAIIVAINPVEQLKRSRDTARKSATGQLASAVSAYYVSKGGTYPTANATWVSTLVTAGELKAAPATVTITAGGTSCASNNQSNYCYVMSGNDFLVFTELEAVADSSKCPSPPNTIPYYLFSSSQAKQGVVCWTTTDPSNVTATYTFL